MTNQGFVLIVNTMKFNFYPTSGKPPSIRPASASRQWMDETPERFAHRCLPLSIANASGWEILNRSDFSAVWHGTPAIESIRIRSEDGETPMAISHFGSGVLTFHITGLFETDPGISLWVGGSPNHIKDGIQPLTGVVETFWSPYSFTMNWKFTRAGQRVWFEKDEPICFIFPMSLDLLESSEPAIRSLSDNPDLSANHAEWSRSRRNFIEDLKEPESEARRRKWQKTYHHGVKPDGSKPESGHRTKMRLKPFE